MIRKSYRQSSVHEYINITKQLPSTNPLRSPTPDIHSRRERIAKTPSPHINRDRLTLQNITNSMTKNSQEHQIESKDAKIALLLKEIENLKRGSKISNTQIFTDPKQGDLFEKLKSQVKIKEDENQDLRRRMEASLQESNAQTDNKIREILLKFYEEINHLKAENKLLNETLHKENNEGKKSLGSSFVEARFIDNNIILPLEKPTISQERYKKAKVQETQGGVISPYHDSQPNSKPMNPTNIQGGTINPYNDPHLQSKPMNQSGTISTYYEPQSKLINPNNIQAGTVSPYHDSYSQSKPMNPNNIQGGNISSYNDPQIQSKPINPNNIQGGTIGTYYDPHLQSKQMNPNNIQGGTYDQINPYHNSQSKPMNPNDTVNEDKLKSIIAEKDNKMRALADELVRLNEALKDKNQEIDGLYDRLRGNYGKNQDLDEAIKMKQHLQEKLQELEELKNKIPNEDHEKLKSIANKTPALIGEITELNDLIARLRNEKYTNEEKITVLAQEIDRLNELLKFTSQEPNTTHKDEKVALLAIEIDRLTNLILTQNTELQRLRSIEFQHDKLKKEHELLIEKYSNKNKSLDTKLKELEQLKEKCLLIDKAFTAEKEGLHEKVNALEKKAHSLISENQDLSKLHRKSISEKETMEQENLRINALKQDLAHELKRLTDTLKSKIHENEQKTQELEVLKTRLFETETHKSVILGSHDTERRKSQSIILENDRKNLQIDSLNQEIASLRNRLLEQETKGFSQEKDHEKLKKSHFDLNHRISTLQGQLDYQVAKDKDKAQGYESELRQKEEDLRELRQKLKGIEQEKSLELAKVRGSISESQYKQMGILAEKENLQMECENLRKERGDYQNKCNELKKALFQATGEVDRFKEQNEEYLLKIVLLSAINEGLNHEVYDLRLENTELLNKFQRVVSEKSIEEIKLKETLNENHKHKEREKRKSVQIIQEKDALNKTLDLISKDKEDLHKKLYENEVKNIDAQSNLRAFSIRYEEALMKIAVMSCEFERLHEIIENESNMRKIELEEVRKDYENKFRLASERKKKENEELGLEFDYETKRLLSMIKGLEEQNEALVRKHANDRSDFIAKYEKAMKETIAKNMSDMNAYHEQELDKVQARISEHQKLADKYKQELEKMASMMSEKHEEVSNWREKVQKLEQQRLLELEELKKHLDLLKSSYINNPNGLEFQAERLAYETNINQLKSRIFALESTLKEKNLRQESQIKEYDKRNHELKNIIRGYESSKESEVMGLKNVNDKLKTQIEEIREKLLKSENDARRLELDVKQLQIALGAVRSELEQVQKSFQLEKLESSRLKMQIKETEMIYKSEYDSKNNYSSDRNNDLNLELNELANQRDEYRIKSEKNELALTEMNGVLIEKIQELEKVKSHYHDAINKLHMLEGKLLEKLQEDEVFIS